MRISLLLVALATPTALHAQSYTGNVSIIDGDTIDMAGTRIRLHGIDAVEREQTCTRDMGVWACGKEASATLGDIIRGRPVECTQTDTDRFGRVVAKCFVKSIDLSSAMADAGLAVALPNVTQDYLPDESRARAGARGIWGANFEQPSAYRAAHPALEPRLVATKRPARAAAPVGVYYYNCDAARAAGAAPLLRGQPGYRPQMDGDNDGVACEPYRGRR